MSDVRLIVNGRRYGGWKGIRITRSIQNLANSFMLDVSDRWAGQAEPWAIVEEDACRVEIDGDTVVDGWVDKRNPVLSGTQRRLAFSGRDRAGALVDCCAVLDRWSFRNASVFDIATKVAGQFGIKVSVQPGLILPKLRKLVANPGDKAWEVIHKAAQSAGVLVVGDGAGGILLTRSGTARATPLIEGQNVLGASGNFDASNRYHRYIVLSQNAGTDTASGRAARVRAEAIDENVRRKHRTFVIRPLSSTTTEHARRRADWEARIRAALADAVTIEVHGWRQDNGELWPVNALTVVRSPGIGAEGEMLISQAVHTISADSSEITQLQLVRPDAFTPEPKAVVRRRGSRWKTGGPPADGAS